MASRSDDVVVPFAAFLEARERRRRVLDASSQAAISPFSDESPTAAAVAAGLPREAISAAADRLLDGAIPAAWTPPESNNRGSH